MFRRDGSTGFLTLDTTDAIFTQAKSTYEDRYHKADHELYTKLLFTGKFFNNSSEAFKQALAAGEIYMEKGADGVERYGFEKAGISKKTF